MIAKTNRFVGWRSLRPLLRRGRRLTAGDQTQLKVLKNRRSTWRLTIIVSKKINKRAVVRNRIRRRLYEFFRREFPKNVGLDIAIIIKSDDWAKISSEQLEKRGQQLLKQLKS